MPYSADNFSYGPVIVLRGKHKGRIGELDDDTTHRGKTCGIVKFAPFGITAYYSIIPMQYMQSPNTQQLLQRHQEIFNQLTPFRDIELGGEDRIFALEELAYVNGILTDRMFTARFSTPPHGAKIFLSHASTDKAFVRGLAVDLAELGHQPWLDEWEILGGDSIPSKIEEGLDQADFVVVVLSKNSVASKWVTQEWQAKFWVEINERMIAIIPLVIDDCKIPTLLKSKKYINFKNDYTDALEELADSITRHLKRRKKEANPSYMDSPQNQD